MKGELRYSAQSSQLRPFSRYLYFEPLERQHARRLAYELREAAQKLDAAWKDAEEGKHIEGEMILLILHTLHVNVWIEDRL